MKKILSILLLCVSLAGFSQSRQIDKVNISSAKIVRSHTVQDIIPDGLQKCKVLSYHFTANLGTSVKSMDVKNGEIPQTIKTVVQELKAGDKFIIENLKYDCNACTGDGKKDCITGDYKKSFVFIIQ